MKSKLYLLSAGIHVLYLFFKVVYELASLRVALNSHQILKAKAKESGVGSERHVTERTHSIQLLKQALPVRLDGDSARSVLAVQVSVQDVYGLLIHC